MPTEQEIFDNLEKELKQEFGNLWDTNKEALKEWATLLAKLEWAKFQGKADALTSAYAKAGLACFKARLQFQMEDATFKLISKVLTAVLQQALVWIKNA